MSIPKATVWQSCRDSGLDTISSDCSLAFKDPINLANWRQRGAFRVVNVSGSRFTIECAIGDIGSAVLGDVESLLNHVAEHRAQVYQAGRPNTWSSPAWLLVTIYYWGFFAALAWTRLMGKGVLYLDRTAVKELQGIWGGKTVGTPAGSYQLQYGSLLSATDREVVLRKLQTSHFHESVWKEVILDAKSRFERHADEEADQLEYRMFSCLAYQDRSSQWAWPSDIRNIINYRAGFAYKEVSKSSTIDLVQFVKSSKFESMEDLIETYENQLSLVSNRSSIDQNPSLYCRFMFLQTLLLTSLCEELFREIVDRRSLDKRLGHRRKAFFKELGMINGEEVWPFVGTS